MNTLNIFEIQNDPIEHIKYQTIPTNEFEPKEFILPIFKGKIKGLPNGIDAIIVTSDLQGVVNSNGLGLLLGEYLANNLEAIFELYFPEIERNNVIAFLCGDLYTNLTKRGESGDPIAVWKSFNSTFGRTIGIAGNHDSFGDSYSALNKMQTIKFIENGIVEVLGLKIGGLSGIIGRSNKNFRLSKDDYLYSLTSILNQKPDILITHLSPAIQEENYQGDKSITQHLLKGAKTILFCGHSHWNTNLPYQLSNGTQVLNADGKVFILMR